VAIESRTAHRLKYFKKAAVLQAIALRAGQLERLIMKCAFVVPFKHLAFPCAAAGVIAVINYRYSNDPDYFSLC